MRSKNPTDKKNDNGIRRCYLLNEAMSSVTKEKVDPPKKKNPFIRLHMAMPTHKVIFSIR